MNTTTNLSLTITSVMGSNASEILLENNENNDYIGLENDIDYIVKEA